MSTGERISNAGSKATAFLWSLSIAVASGWFVSIEWTHPLCQNQSDGPVNAAYGFPFPFVQWPGVTSLEYDFMPHIYALNMTILVLALYPLVRIVTNQIARITIAHRVNMIAGWSIGIVVLCFEVLHISVFFRPVLSIGSIYDDRPYPATTHGLSYYWSYRPVSITTEVLRYSCTPSTYWFGDSP
jgi:hypothetical protein